MLEETECMLFNALSHFPNKFLESRHYKIEIFSRRYSINI